MPPPVIFVMSSRAVGPRHDRRPAGLVHAAPRVMPPVNETFCGLVSLFWFGDVDFESLDMSTVDGRRCPECEARVSERRRPPAGRPPGPGPPRRGGDGAVTGDA